MRGHSVKAAENCVSPCCFTQGGRSMADCPGGPAERRAKKLPPGNIASDHTAESFVCPSEHCCLDTSNAHLPSFWLWSTLGVQALLLFGSVLFSSVGTGQTPLCSLTTPPMFLLAAYASSCSFPFTEAFWFVDRISNRCWWGSLFTFGIFQKKFPK